MKPSPFLSGVAIGAGVGALVTLGYVASQALTVRNPETMWRTRAKHSTDSRELAIGLHQGRAPDS